MNQIKIILLAVFFASATPVLAHDEGHGPITDAGNYGGVITVVVESKGAPKGTEMPLVYQAELTRSEDGTVRVYVYDKIMKPFLSESLGKTANALVISPKDGKEIKTPFTLILEGTAFVGMAPKPAGKPFRIDVTFKAGDKEFLASFHNLD